MKRIVILGGGTGGLIASKELSEALNKEAEIILVDKKNAYRIQTILFICHDGI
jgi:NADH dehydrogenase FAD-containing subunit